MNVMTDGSKETIDFQSDAFPAVAIKNRKTDNEMRNKFCSCEASKAEDATNGSQNGT